MLFSQFILGFKGVFVWAKTGLSQNDVLEFLNWKFKTERIERNRISYTAVDGFSEMLAYLTSNFKIQQKEFTLPSYMRKLAKFKF